MLNILIPMAGRGSRFANKGYTFPKPLIEIKNKPMIEWVVGNLRPRIKHRFIFICRKEHCDTYRLRESLALIAPGCEVITVDKVTEGAACTALLAKDHIANDDSLMIANSDQYIDEDINHFIEEGEQDKHDGLILTFHATHPKWSFAKVGSDGFITQVAEKNPISTHATVGIYYYKKGNDFVGAAEEMIHKNIRTNDEFYICPAYNEMILAGKKIGIFAIDATKMHGLGTPEDLESFLTTPLYQSL